MRKRIAVITIDPGNEHHRDTLWGIFNQAKIVDYDVCVITPMVQISHHFKDYLSGELNIYELINFRLFDGVIIMPVAMREDRIETLAAHLLDKLKKECKVPVISLEEALGDYPIVKTDNVTPFDEITEHIINVHGVKDISILAGMKGYPISEARIEGCMNAAKRNGIEPYMINIHYGNFWYNSGEKLADDIASGAVHRPGAVIALSDHMAIGLVGRLKEHGIRVPEDIIVTGHGASKEAILSTPPLTSYKANERDTGALAVIELRKLIEPDANPVKQFTDNDRGVRIGCTCGCKEDIKYTRGRLSEFLFLNEQNYVEGGEWKGVDIGMLLESYTSEILTKTETVEECLNKIYESLYLIKPYEWFYLCLGENWLERELDITTGYPKYMRKVIISDMAKLTHGYVNHIFYGPGRDISFESKEMLPELQIDFGKPQVFFFMPLHFSDRMLGYAVLQNDLDQKVMPGLMFKNYLRYLSNALEMTRTRNRIVDISEHDILTGLYNRRGMDSRLSKMIENKAPDDRWLAIVVDMDGLKKINDTFGHNYGDEGIKAVARAVKSIVMDGEFCVRAGGDEFYIFGLGKYKNGEPERRARAFEDALWRENDTYGNMLTYDASLGAYLAKPEETDPMKIAGMADVEMYIKKNHKKASRS